MYENPEFVSPNLIRSNAKKQKSFKYGNKVDSKDWHKEKKKEAVLPVDEIDGVFKADDFELGDDDQDGDEDQDGDDASED